MALSARFKIIIFTLLTSLSVHAEQSLTIERAVQLGLERDSLIVLYKARHDAFKEQSFAEDTLPDPSIKLGLMNLPTDSFAQNQEAMTQLQIGIQQMFPRGDSLEIKSQRAISLSLAENAKAENQRRIITRDVRQNWLELYYWTSAAQVVSKNRSLFRNLVSVTQQQYAAGRQKQQDFIRSELELGMLEDREINIKTMIEKSRVNLAKYIGNEFAQIKLDSILPKLIIPTKKNLSWLEQHPMLLMEDAMVKTNQKNVELARQTYKPSWMLDLTYGEREATQNGVERANLVSAMVVFDLPLFTADKQDKLVAASKFRLNGAKSSRQERKRELKKMWSSNIVTATRLEQRIKNYQTFIVPKARENTKAAHYSYQSGRSGFTGLMRAQITELEAQLRALRLKVNYAKTQTQILYLVGEND